MDTHKPSDQFQPPRTEYSQELYAALEHSAAPKTPEKLRAPFQMVKDVEKLVDSFRETAEALEQRDGREMKIKYVPVTIIGSPRTHDEIAKSQKNIERRMTMDLFAEKGKHCVHYDGKVSTPYATPDIGHWYIESNLKDGTPGTGEVTHIETHPQYINIFNHDGQRVPARLSHLAAFIPLAYHYARTVIDAYPFERDRAEVILDGLDIPEDISALLPPEHHGPSSQSDYRLAA